MIRNTIAFFILVSLVFSACKTTYPVKHQFPKPVNTSSVKISEQEKKVYSINGIQASNDFPAARMNDFQRLNDSTYQVTILPENEPINESPHYAFSLSSDTKRSIHLEIYYGRYKHRYYPKISHDLKNWTPIDSLRFDTLMAGNRAHLILDIDDKPLYVAAQEIRDSKHTDAWIGNLKQSHPQIKSGSVGLSHKGRPIPYMDIVEGEAKDKPAILIFSRTHPPEISGYMAMEAYVEELLGDSKLSRAFREKFRILVYPLINPDGVDMGHWRHNVGGTDLNRDWAEFQQPETEAVARHVSESVSADNNTVLLGMDFHSTQEDVIYTHTANRQSVISPYKDLWLEALSKADLHPNEEPYDLSTPMTKGWFYLEFGAEAIIYEVGDETDREYLKYKSRTAAQEMMKLLVLSHTTSK